MKRIIFAGTPEIAATVLQALCNTKHEIICCLTQPDRPQGRGLHVVNSAVKTCALQHNIPVLQPKSLKSAAIQQQLADLKPDLMIVMAYGLLLPSPVLTIPKLGCINIHASILPRWRGAAPIQYAILSGDTESGITIMQMEAGLDTGNILATYPCQVFNTDTSADLHDRLMLLAESSCIDLLEKLSGGKITAVPQDNKLATYAHKIDKHQAQINWQQSAVEIDRCVRAYNPWPIAFTSFMQQTVRVWSSEVVSGNIIKAHGKPGTILAVDKQSLHVATGAGVLKILTLQFPGKKALPVAAICNSNKNLLRGAIFV